MASLDFAIVQPDTASDDDRGCIIDAAYRCLSEPHSGPIPVAAILHLTVIDSDEVRAAKGYRETRERAHADRERSLIEILRRGRADGSFPQADPEHDAVAISAVISREMANQSPGDEARLQRSLDWVL